MVTNKTIANDSSVDAFIDSLADPAQAADSRTLVDLFHEITGEKPVMWGDAIIGFGVVHLTYASGRSLEWLRVGFSPRKGKLSLYVTFDATTLTSQFPHLGRYTVGKGCIYIKKLTDIDLDELAKLIRTAVKTGYQQPKRADGKEQISKQS